ncbi:mechanosensitive ion channel [Pseudohalocynthiibacter aestuariivivens]|nr:mechanosensitive ion channel domain-containing protein [Pseudohalocynthiibacter aestuariivivens]QIE44518.1 mechanosensitive ion channel [Pseudohalocynthiibacter aestuariivivens]
MTLLFRHHAKGHRIMLRLSRLGAQIALIWVLISSAAAQDAAFDVPPLNAGLGTPPPSLDRSTPQGTIESFLELGHQGNFAEAAHLLDLGDIPAPNQPLAGPLLAEQLFVVMDRKVVIPWDRLPDRPDGWLSGPSDNEAVGRVRRSIVLDWLDLGYREVPVRLNRVAPATSDAVWVFARQSVGNIGALHMRYGPTNLEKRLPAWSRQRAVAGMYLWEVLFLPLLVIVSALVGWLTYRIVGGFQRRRDTRLTRAIVRALRWPATIAITVGFIGFVTRNVMVVSGLLDSFVSPAVVIGFVTAVTLAVVLIIDEVLDHISQNNPHELAEPENAHLRNMATTISAARKFIIVIAVITGAGLILSSANTFETLGLSLLASAGALTIVLGFAAREVLGNILASVQIAMNRSARIGDQLIFEGHFCTVERIHFTYVQLAIWNGNRLIVPVSYFVRDAFQNWSIEDVRMIRLIELTLAQTADVDAMRDFFFDKVETEDGDDTGPLDKAKVLVTGQDVFGQKVLFGLPTSDPATSWAMECKMREQLLEKAREIERETGRQMLPSENVQGLPTS